MNRDELIQLSVEGKIKYKKKFLKEADDETIEKICKEVEAMQFDEVNEQLVDMLLEKFSEMMSNLELVKSKCDLEKDLTKNKLLKKDLKTIAGYITPLVQFVEVISGGLTVGGHVASKKMSTDEKSEEEEEK